MRLFHSTSASTSAVKLSSWSTSAALLLACSTCVAAIALDMNDNASIKSAAAIVAHDLMSFYKGNETGGTPGILPFPGYYWWESGGMWNTMMNYWHLTGDSQYNGLVSEAMLYQVGANRDYLPSNQSSSEGNDDQVFWGLAAMSAAELKFTDPPPDQPQWLTLAQAVFNGQAIRWDTTNCGGGLRWQIYPVNSGYDYKNSVANGGFFQLSSRLAKYTGNTTYSDWAEKTWDWMTTVGLISPQFNVWDGTHISNCASPTKDQWTYNSGMLILGAANMYNLTNGSSIWHDRLAGLVKASSIFYIDGVMAEGCEAAGCPTVDQQSFKAWFARWQAAATQLAPFIYPLVMPNMITSARAAAKQCTGGPSGTMCGTRWTTGVYDGTTGAGQQMCALEAIQSNLISQAKAPVTNQTGGTSLGDPNAGTAPISLDGTHWAPLTAGDRAGGVTLTLLSCLLVVASTWWMCT